MDISTEMSILNEAKQLVQDKIGISLMQLKQEKRSYLCKYGRMIFVNYCNEKGLSLSTIARILRKSVKDIEKIIVDYRTSCYYDSEFKKIVDKDKSENDSILIGKVLDSIYTVTQMTLSDFTKKGKTRKEYFVRLFFTHYLWNKGILYKDLVRLTNRDRTTLVGMIKKYEDVRKYDKEFSSLCDCLILHLHESNE